MKPLHKYITGSKIITDFICITISFLIAYFLRVADYSSIFPYTNFYISSLFPLDDFIYPALITLPVWIIGMYFVHGYKIEANVRNWNHFVKIIFIVMMGLATYLVTFFFLQKTLFSRLIVLLIFVFSSSLLYLNHFIFDKIAKHYFGKGQGTWKTLIIGTTREAQKLVELLKKDQSIHEPIAILDGYGTKLKEIAGVPILGKLNIFEETVKNYNIEQIIQTDNLEQTINIINFSLKNNIKYAMLPTLLGVHGNESTVEEIEGLPVVRVK